MKLPDYDELPESSAGASGSRTGWGVFGADDQVGLLNLLTPDVVRAAVGLVRTGSVFSLNAPLDAFDPPIVAWRENPVREIVHRPGSVTFDERYTSLSPQGASQWDSLGHVGAAPNCFYNGATEDDVASGRRNGIEHWARRGIVGRAVVLDMVRTAEEDGHPYDPGSPTAFTVEDLERARRRSGVTFRPGDILVLHTGFARWYADQSEDRCLQVRADLETPGIARGEDMCRYLWNNRLSAVVSDNLAVEVTPLGPDERTGFLHRVLIGQLGMALGELWWTEELADDCARDGVYEALLVSAPMHAVGGFGSPANALALK